MKYWVLGFFTVVLVSGALYYELQKNFDVVIPDEVYRSGQLHPNDLESAVGKYGIRTVINLRGSHPAKTWYREEQATLERLNVGYRSINLRSTRLPSFIKLPRLVTLLSDSPRPVLIHCDGGADRAGLASVITLLINGKQKPEQVQKHLSWRYFVIKQNSVGKQFLEKYLQWLKRQNLEHHSKQFLEWMANHYIDGQGNLRFYIDSVQGVSWSNKPDGEDVVTVDQKKDMELHIQGWAFDLYNRDLLASVDVMLGHLPMNRVDYRIVRQGVADYFSDKAYLKSGWRATHNIRTIPNGCHALSLRLVRMNGSIWNSPPYGRICLRQIASQ